VQEFTYNASTQAITPKSVPCISTDDTWAPEFCICDQNGTLYVTGSQVGGSGLLARNIAVYVKTSGERALVTQAPATTTWATDGRWASAVTPDFSLATPVAQALGICGPLAIDSQTGAVLFPAATGYLGAVVPASSSVPAASPNLLADQDASFEPPNIITAQDSYLPSAGVGSWTVFAGSCTLAQGTAPVTPSPPSAGTALKMTATGNAEMDAHTGSYPVVPGQLYGISASFLADTGMVAKECDLWVRWLDASQTLISDSTNTVINPDATGSWTTTANDFSVTAPANAAFGQVWCRVKTVTTGQAHWITDVFLWDLTTGWAGTVTTVRRTDRAAFGGLFSLAMIAPFTQSVVVARGPVTSVQPLTEYQASGWFRADSGVPAGTCSLGFNWFDANGNQIGSTAGIGKTIADSSSVWSTCYASALSPASAITGQVVATVSGSSMTAGQMHLLDSAVMQQNPWTAPPACEMGVAAMRAGGNAVGAFGRPAISGRSIYVPWPRMFTSAENAAYGSSYVPDTAHPQYVSAVQIDQFLAGGYGAVTKDEFIRSITHDFSPDSAPFWQTTWQLQSAARYGNFLILNQSPQGRLGTGALAY
jgi:hypothetical protein